MQAGWTADEPTSPSTRPRAGKTWPTQSSASDYEKDRSAARGIQSVGVRHTVTARDQRLVQRLEGDLRDPLVSRE